MSTPRDALVIRPSDDVALLPASAPTVRDVLRIAFRHRLLIASTFCLVFAAVMILNWMFPTYSAEMKILVKQQRSDVPISTEQNAPVQVPTRPLTLEDVNAEAELMGSRDILQQTALQAGLVSDSWSWRSLYLSADQMKQRRIEKATKRLNAALDIQPITNSPLLLVQYKDGDPARAAHVLNVLAALYIDKHIALHRTPGKYEFFQRQVQDYASKLEDAEKKLEAFGANEAVSPALERDSTLKSIADMEAVLQTTQSNIAEARNRLNMLQQEAGNRPPRLTTAERTYQNPQLHQDLQSTLLKLELQRTDLLTKYAPTYRLVRQVEEQIAQTKARIKAIESRPLQDQTTDRDPTFTWIDGEIAKTRADLKMYLARATATQKSIAELRERAKVLDAKAIDVEQLQREVKTQQANYELYTHKLEEARISDQMDRDGMLNVAIAEPPAVPTIGRPITMVVLVGFVLAFICSMAMMLLAEFFDRSFRTPDEVERILQLPVLAAIPAPGHEPASAHM